MTHITVHIAFLKACNQYERIGVCGTVRDYEDCRHMMRKADAARRATNLMNAEKLYLAAAEIGKQ